MHTSQTLSHWQFSILSTVRVIVCSSDKYVYINLKADIHVVPVINIVLELSKLKISSVLLSKISQKLIQEGKCYSLAENTLSTKLLKSCQMHTQRYLKVLS